MLRYFKPMKTIVSALCVLALTSSIAFAQLPTPSLSSIFPPGGKQGSTVEAQITGANLDDSEKLVFSHPGITAQPKMSEPSDFSPTPTKVPDRFSITIAADVPPGVYEVRHVSRYGATNPRAFAVSSLAEVANPGNNKSKQTAIDLTENSAITGKVDPNALDFYALQLKAGQHVVIDCLAQRIDSRMNSTLVMYGPNGKELSRVLNTVGLDPVMDFTAPAEGRYVVGVYDFVYGGGADFFYRLSVTAAPQIDFVFPPAGPPGSNNQYTLYGRNLPGGQPAEGLTIDGSPLQKLAVNIAIPGEETIATGSAVVGTASPRAVMVDSIEYKLATPQGTSNAVAIGVSRQPQIVEVEPNDNLAASQKIVVPCEYVGQFFPQRDRDWVQFDAKKGEIYWLEVIAHRLDRLCDPTLLIQRVTKNDKGEEVMADVALVDDAPDRPARVGSDFDISSDDPSFKLSVPDDGTYRVMVRDQYGDSRKDPRFVYRLIVRKEEPDFRVAVFPDLPGNGKPQDNNQVAVDNFTVRKSGTAMLRVMLERRDEFSGDVLINVEGLPGGVTSTGAILGGGVNAGTLIIVASDAAAAWTGPIRIVAKATINGQEKSRVARYGTLVWGTQNRQQIPPTFRAMRDLVLCVVDRDPELASIQVSDGNMIEMALGGKIELPVNVARRGEFKDPLKLVAVGLPNEIKPKDLSLDNSKNDGKLEIELNQQNMKPGTYTFCVRADSKVSYARNPQSVATAEAEKKQLEDTIAAFTEKLKVATAARDAATKAAADAKTAAQQAEQGKNQAAAEVQQKQDAEKVAAQEKLTAAEKTLADAQAAVKTTDEAKVKADAEVKLLDDKVKLGAQMKQQFDQKFNNIKTAAAPKDVQVSFLSTPVKVRIVASPIKLVVPATADATAGTKVEVPVSIERLYTFGEPVEVTFDPPAGVPGLPQAKAMIPAGQTVGKLEYTAQANAPAGDHTFSVKARGKFGNVNFETIGQIVIKVAAAAK